MASAIWSRAADVPSERPFTGAISYRTELPLNAAQMIRNGGAT
jgi:hypothetical protein